MMGHENTLALQAAFSGQTEGLDTFRGTKAGDTGITAFYVGPQVTFTWRAKLIADLGVDLPISLDNTAFQAVVGVEVRRWDRLC